MERNSPGSDKHAEDDDDDELAVQYDEGQSWRTWLHSKAEDHSSSEEKLHIATKQKTKFKLHDIFGFPWNGSGFHD